MSRLTSTIHSTFSFLRCGHTAPVTVRPPFRPQRPSPSPHKPPSINVHDTAASNIGAGHRPPRHHPRHIRGCPRQGYVLELKGATHPQSLQPPPEPVHRQAAGVHCQEPDKGPSRGLWGALCSHARVAGTHPCHVAGWGACPLVRCAHGHRRHHVPDHQGAQRLQRGLIPAPTHDRQGGY
jgi:hypothetical protein